MTTTTILDIIKLRSSFLLLPALLLMLSIPACTKFVKVEPPKSQLLGEVVFDEAGTAEAAMAGLYTELRAGYNGIFTGESMGMSIYLSQYADELDNLNPNTIYQSHGPNFFKNTLFSDSEDLLSMWTTSYNHIYNANAIVEGLARSAISDSAVKARLTGEALFIRALVHFYLANLYGDIPYVTTTDYLANRSLNRTSVKQVYQQVLTDLQMALEKLPESYPTPGRVRVNKWVAKALMARVFLYDENWERAEELSTELIDQGTYVPESDLSRVFLKESTSTIWAFQPNMPGNNTLEGFTHFISHSEPSRAMSQWLFSAFEPDDQRKSEWVGTYTGNGKTLHFSFKYKYRNEGGTVDYEYPIVLRIEEQYLIRAEARAHMELFDQAAQDINVLRSRAGLSNTTSSTLDEFSNAILHERQVELCMEYGHRFFDLKRMEKLDEILGAEKPNWNHDDRLLPIPEKELLVNRNFLPQNPGYN